MLNSHLPFPQYTFENFIVGNNNRFAYSASKGVAEAPGRIYNPLFVYSGVGLGKTHLMCAIGNHILENNSKAKIVYITVEQFMLELIDKLEHGQLKEFRKKYWEIDCLLIDDIEFLAGQDEIQVEFTHTFDYLFAGEKQIVLTSDRPPRDLKILHNRLKNRFEGGLVADMQSPEFETRVAILMKKLELKQIKANRETIYEIAERITTNVRELEGALNKMIAISTISKVPLDLELAREVLKDIAPLPNREETYEQIIRPQDVDSEFASFITDVEMDISASIAHNEQAVQIREEYERKLYIWAMKGYDVASLKEAMNKDINAIESIFAQYTILIEKLIEYQKQLATMDVRGFEKELKEIEENMFNPAMVEVLDYLIKDLSSKSERREKYRELLKPSLNFDNFVVGECNKVAHSLARSIAIDPKVEYNPLFIYGPSGTGKTHLLHSIGNYIKYHNPVPTVLYIHSENFVNDLIKALEHNTIDEFREKFREVDILLFDDVYLLKNRERTQEEFFHCFNVLYTKNKQIVITANVPPAELDNIEDRLRSRFMGGLVAGIERLDSRTKVALIGVLAYKHGLDISDEAILLISSKLGSNTRTIMESLAKLADYAEEYDNKIDRAVVIQVLGLEQIVDFPKKTFTLNAFRQISKFTIAEGKLSDNWSSLTDSIDLVYRS